MKAALTSLNTFSSSNAINVYAYYLKHSLAVLCKFLGDFWAFREKNIFFSKGRY